MRKKHKIIISILIIALGTALNMLFTTNMHNLLKGNIKVVRLYNLTQIFRSMFNHKEHLLLFIAFEGLIILGAIFYCILNNKPYESNLIKITKDINTPVSAGQKQHGSARWLTDKEKDKYFNSITLKYSDLITQQSSKKYTEILQKSGGIVVGMKKEGFNNEHIYYIDDDTHSLCIGATRSGKTRCIVLQSIGLLGLAGENMIISDDFKNPLKSDRYNFLQPIIDLVDEGNIPKAIDASMVLAIRTPKFIQEFLIISGGQSGGLSNKIYSSARIYQMSKTLFKR